MKKHSAKLIAGIVIVAILVFLLWNGIAVDDQFVSEPEYGGPDTEMIGVSMDSYGEHGELLYKLTADSIAYEKEKGVYQISQPNIRHFDEDSDIWQLKAAEATVETKSPSGESIHHPVMRLDGGVTVEGPTGSFKSTALTYHPNEHTVFTPHEVSIQYEDSSVTAKGMQLNLEAGTYELNTESEPGTQSVMKLTPRADQSQSR